MAIVYNKIMDSYDVLVIILSVALGISLFVWIFVGVLVAQFIKRIKSATDSAQHAVENVESFTEQMKHAGRATAIGSIISQVTKAFKGNKKEK